MAATDDSAFSCVFGVVADDNWTIARNTRKFGPAGRFEPEIRCSRRSRPDV